MQKAPGNHKTVRTDDFSSIVPLKVDASIDGF